MKQIISALFLLALWSNATAQANKLKEQTKMTNLIDKFN